MIESTIGIRRASYWQAILWKDLRLLTPSFVTIVVGALVIQMLQFLGVYLSNEPNLRGDASAFTMLLTYTAPVLIGMAAGGMLVGHERQTGTWNWNTSLPVVWWHALGAKLVVSFAGIMVAFAVLLIVPIAAYRVFEVNTDFVRLLSLAPYSLLVGLLTTLFLYLFALLLRETLTALVLGAMALAVCMIFATTMVVHFIAQSAFGITNVFNHPLYPSILLLVFAGLVALAGVVLMPVFRWRWQAGQHVEWRVRRRRRVAAHARWAVQAAHRNLPF